MANGKGWKEEYLDGCLTEDQERVQVFGRFGAEIQGVIEHFAAENKGNKRGLHAKFLAGVTNAIFRVAPKEILSEDFRVGFLRPDEKYNAIVRFSNAGSKVEANDSNPEDLRGVAIRVETTPGDHQGDHDFLMTNAEPHHAKDAKEAMAAIVAKAGGLAGVGSLIHEVGLFEVGRMKWTVARQMARPVESLATETYWSRAPIAIGPDVQNHPENAVAVKYRLKAVLDKPEHPKPCPDLTTEFTQCIAQRPLLFLFQVQQYVDEHRTPIEDATVQWESEYETIAELIIPRQDPPVQMDSILFDGLVFKPWNVDKRFFRPLGSMNRVRKVVYPASVEGRSRSES
jgi:hypothetical protein